jgi:hypothetical protein
VTASLGGRPVAALCGHGLFCVGIDPHSSLLVPPGGVQGAAVADVRAALGAARRVAPPGSGLETPRGGLSADSLRNAAEEMLDVVWSAPVA